MGNRKRSRRRHSNSGLGWPLLLVVAGLALFAVAVIALQQDKRPPVAVDVNGASALRVNQEQFDLGDVKLGKQVKVEVEVSNAGDQPLLITGQPYIEVIAGC
jgi:hypothetical protein